MIEINADFIKDRDEALLSMDRAKIVAYMEKYGAKVLPNKFFWASVHKARTGAKLLPMAERAASKHWLDKRGFSALDDGAVMPPIEDKNELKKCYELCEKFEQMQ